jgi:hypothetical protein
LPSGEGFVKPASPALDATLSWKYLVEAASFETNPKHLSRRIQDAQDAIMNHIEDLFETTSQSERQAMINAVNSLDRGAPNGDAAGVFDLLNEVS